MNARLSLAGHPAPALLRRDGSVAMVGRFGTVDEVSDIVVMLAGNGYMTGQTISPNGGWYMS